MIFAVEYFSLFAVSFCIYVYLWNSTSFRDFRYVSYMPDYGHLKLHDQFVALTDMKLQSQNQLYMSFCF